MCLSWTALEMSTAHCQAVGSYCQTAKLPGSRLPGQKRLSNCHKLPFAKMSGAGHEEECKEVREEGKREQEASQASVEGRSRQLNLFKAVGVKNPAYWQSIFYIAPNNEQKKWKPSDAVGTYCKECKITIPYDAKTNTRAVSRHMDRFHKDLLESFERNDNKKRKSNGKIEAFFPKEVKKVKVAAKADQDHFTKLIARWTASCLRPFAISEEHNVDDTT